MGEIYPPQKRQLIALALAPGSGLPFAHAVQGEKSGLREGRGIESRSGVTLVVVNITDFPAVTCCLPDDLLDP